MTEHDAPTVARATLWLDTSSDTPTKPNGECFDELATTRVRRIQTTLSFAAPEQHTTASFVRAAPPRSESMRIPMIGPSPRALAGALGIAVLAIVVLVFLNGQLSAGSIPDTQPAIAKQAEPSRSSGEPPASATAQRSAPPDAGADASEEPSPGPLTKSAAPAHGSTKAAVDALARGDYPRALSLYRALSAQHPHDAAIAAIAQLLENRTKRSCSDPAHPEGPCGG